MCVKICIVGCGALGSVIGAHLARLKDVEVHAYDVSQEHVRAIRERGLQISGAAEFSVKLHATSDAREIPVCDFGIFATKSPHTRAAVEQTAHIFGTSGAVCSVQNGLGNEEIIAERVRYVIRGAQWTKLIFNSAVNPVGALTRLHHGAANRFPPSAALYEGLLREGESVARALGITLHGDTREMIAEGARATGKRNVSMLMDILAKRESEIDFINGAIADRGEQLGVLVPLNRAMWQLVKGLEHSWSDPS